MAASLAAERSYMRHTLPRGVGRGLAAAVTGDSTGVLRAGSIVIGLSLTTIGYMIGYLRSLCLHEPVTSRPSPVRPCHAELQHGDHR
jgi:hypothetical protein